jgi:hypothetical protein
MGAGEEKLRVDLIGGVGKRARLFRQRSQERTGLEATGASTTKAWKDQGAVRASAAGCARRRSVLVDRSTRGKGLEATRASATGRGAAGQW